MTARLKIHSSIKVNAILHSLASVGGALVILLSRAQGCVWFTFPALEEIRFKIELQTLIASREKKSARLKVSGITGVNHGVRTGAAKHPKRRNPYRLSIMAHDLRLRGSVPAVRF
ncbi:hypothetical protein DFH08DRAFT_810282 [Mycena albidolilacea]|uniref:Uncharacterized protein n=1 Tax=Mycena albidolilacea TaxID=1033008 RepID=A0AAD6ZXR6_9AGAR|nr:hypothetical protein DFH08DRAFT_810282 [Mycena albidolilacea]